MLCKTVLLVLFFTNIVIIANKQKPLTPLAMTVANLPGDSYKGRKTWCYC